MGKLERSGLISFEEVKSSLETAVRKNRAILCPSGVERVQPTSVEYLLKYLGKKLLEVRVDKH